MKFLLKRVLVNLLLVSSINTYADDVKICPVDDRVNDLSTAISDIDSGKLQSNLKLSSETLLGLKPKVVALLKDRYEIFKPDCSTIKIIAGEPTEKLEVSFSSLFNELIKAVSNKDDARVKYLIATYKPLQLTAVTAFGTLLVPAPVPAAISEQLATILSINKIPASAVAVPYSTTNSITGANEVVHENFVLLSDVFRVLGGQIVGDLPTQKVDFLHISGQYTFNYQLFKKACVSSFGVMKYDITPLFM